eukprot:341278_1
MSAVNTPGYNEFAEALCERPLLSEAEQKKINYKALINGYVRTEIVPTVLTPQNIIQLFIKYSQILDIPPQDNPVNFISDQDITKCNRYKSEGNACFKAKQLNEAVTKYTTALGFNPNNHFVLNNRALCHYMLKNYRDAEQDAKDSIQKSPTFGKAWYRYGNILEKQSNHKFAGICYQTAYFLSVDWETDKHTQTKNHFKNNYDKYMDKLKTAGKDDAVRWIQNFDANKSETTSEDLVQNVFSQMGKNEDDIKNMMNSPGGMQNLLMQLMQNETFLDNEEEEMLYSLVKESQYKHLLKTNDFDEEYTNTNDNWCVSWSSTATIMNNKRLVTVNVTSDIQGKCISQFTHYGVPTTQDVLQYLYRTMSFANLTKVKGSKPKSLDIAWRLRFMFDEIQRAMNTLGVICRQETLKESARVCHENNTDVNGWNHSY